MRFLGLTTHTHTHSAFIQYITYRKCERKKEKTERKSVRIRNKRQIKTKYMHTHTKFTSKDSINLSV